ncbi:NADH oxidase [Candidatus Acidianus copahuensis]|uniref:NADH oxidase n=1 Tax=Candidatus Acidianus copahuensis TaxID=1160895 RepID=A0A031LPN0_9CREN|nr:tRNA-dihydrouridine synthase [Candidatus Acidianus copahuensis]EZQ07047.1 NADH oxidase [Candidatus Acidianus copahuensis]
MQRAFSPIEVGGIKLKNRLAMSPMISNLGAPDGYPTDSHILYMLERAIGGIGLIITEYTYINKVDSRGSVNELGIYSDELIPKFFRLTEMIHRTGSKVFIQLVHVGRKTRKNIIWNNTPVSPSQEKLMDEVREMDRDDIERIEEDFAEASVRAEMAGFDGIEIHGAHGYLIAQFLSPAINKRKDRYSDGVVFVEEVLKRIREKVNIPVGMRISSTEFDNEGLNPEMVSKIVYRLQNMLDYVHFSAGRDGPYNASMPFYYKRVSFIEEAMKAKEGLKIPVFLAGSILTPADVERALEVVDVVVIGRQMLADPKFPEKMKSGDPIRPCIRCNQSCRGVVIKEVRCDVNPLLGWEGLSLPQGKGEVYVIGGGVQGLEASRTLALRGFDVTLYERAELGGQFNDFIDPYKRKEFLPLVDYYKEELERLEVRVIKKEVTECENCIWAIGDPSPTFPQVSRKTILIDSNIYAYQDYAFKLAENNEVYITTNSLSELDRTRRYFLIKIYGELGVKVVDKPIQADVTLKGYLKNQWNIGSAIKAGFINAISFGRES